ncbi:MAG: helicase, partial [bacterium]|nr:helicase [bacterium]
YFSGFERLYKGLENIEMRILVGMEVERDFLNRVKEVELLEKVNISRGEIRENYYKSLVRLIDDTDFFDSKEKEEAFNIYLEKIRNGSLKIKKTIEPNHSKLYLFEYKTEAQAYTFSPGILVTGSSNLSRSGLKERNEVNVILRSPNDYKEGLKLFDGLWETAVDIVNPDIYDRFEEQVINKIWIQKLIDPYHMYVRVLDELFSKKKKRRLKYPSEISKERYFDLKYQTDAVESAMEIIERHGGVIVSDVVGLGKSIVASVAAYNLGLKTIIIAPPHLIQQWETYHWDFDVNAKVYSSGKIKAALQDNHADEEQLVIVDEAHKYRNEDTDNYADLHRLCQGNKVILLTATPFSNKPGDIFSMVKLFQVPAKSSIQSAENLALRFKELVREYKEIDKAQRNKSESPELIKRRIGKLAEEIRGLLGPVIIRRTRLDLAELEEYRDDLDKQNIVFPRVEDPICLSYALGELSGLYLQTLRSLVPEAEGRGFIGARYMPVNYLKDFQKYRDRITEEFGDERLFRQSQVNLALFMRRLLVARFESSIRAFEKTLAYMIASSYIMIDWFDKAKLVPIFKKGYIADVNDLMEDLDEGVSDEIRDLVSETKIQSLKDKGYEFIPANELKVGFKKDIQRDIVLLESIRDQWFRGGVKKDPKLEYFKKTVKEKLEREPRRKLVVFTSYADTAHYLEENLDGFRVYTYTGGNASQGRKQVVKENFDAGWPVQKDDYDILVATDAISEGYNLHRAGAIFNYDIPYNPTRVIQRVGRINRINKKVFDVLYIYNFFPTDIGEREVGVRRISTLKKAVINALMGADTKVLTSDEELNSFFIDPVKKKLIEQEELSWDTRYIRELENLKRTAPEILETARKIPKRVRIRRIGEKEKSGVLVFGKKGEEYVFKLGVTANELEVLSPQEALTFFYADGTEKPLPVSTGFHDIYDFVKANLFVKKVKIPMDKGRRELLNTLTVLISSAPAKKDYLKDLFRVVDELDALPTRFARLIRGIRLNGNGNDAAAELQKHIPHRYLTDIIQRARRVEEGDEQLIFAEELE